MEIWQILLIVAGADALAALAMLAVRRRAGTGFFRDPLQMTAALQVSGTIFAVMVGFAFLVAFQSYGNARTASAAEAGATLALAGTVQLLPEDERDDLSGDLVCYARSVVNLEWPAMAEGPTPDPATGHWVEQAQSDVQEIRPHAAIEGAVGENWFERSDEHRAARADRLEQARPLVPMPVWLLLVLGGTAVVALVLLLADRRERGLSQALMVAGITTLIAASLITVAFLDQAYGNHPGAIGPRPMEATLATIEEQLPPAVLDGLLCDPAGRPASA